MTRKLVIHKRQIITSKLVWSALTGTSPIGGRGLYVIEPRHNLATKVMANGVEVIVAGDKSTLPGSPLLKVIPTGLAKPITLAPSTLTDHMMMVLPPESQVRYLCGQPGSGMRNLVMISYSQVAKMMPHYISYRSPIKSL